MKRRGFTLVELLVVVAIVALLAAILFPVFASARGKARQAACLSNLRQIGIAMALYAQDNDDQFPYAADPSDQHTVPNIWSLSPHYAQVQALPPLQDVLAPYLHAPAVWHCPSDTGFDTLDMLPTGVSAIALAARPTAYAAFGTSYLFRTEAAILHLPWATLVGYDSAGGAHGPSEINVLMDGNGSWHGGAGGQSRFDVLMADGRVVNVDRADYFTQSWSLSLNPPDAGP